MGLPKIVSQLFWRFLPKTFKFLLYISDREITPFCQIRAPKLIDQSFQFVHLLYIITATSKISSSNFSISFEKLEIFSHRGVTIIFHWKHIKKSSLLAWKFVTSWICIKSKNQNMNPGEKWLIKKMMRKLLSFDLMNIQKVMIFYNLYGRISKELLLWKTPVRNWKKLLMSCLI